MTEDITQNISNSEPLNQIYYKFQEVDKKLKELEKANQKIIVTGGKSHPQPKPINISEEELINVYNYTPQILAEYGMTVSVSEATYREKTAGNIYLEYTNNGYYWVILTEYNYEKFYFLVPNAVKQFNLHRLKNQLESLFIIKGDKPSKNNNIILEKLAVVEILPNGNQWELINKGVFQIGTLSPAKKLLIELEKITKINGHIPESLEELLDLVEKANELKSLTLEKNKSLERELKIQKSKFSQFNTILNQEINELKKEVLKQQQLLKNSWSWGAVIAIILLFL